MSSPERPGDRADEAGGRPPSPRHSPQASNACSDGAPPSGSRPSAPWWGSRPACSRCVTRSFRARRAARTPCPARSTSSRSGRSATTSTRTTGAVRGRSKRCAGISGRGRRPPWPSATRCWTPSARRSPARATRSPRWTRSRPRRSWPPRSAKPRETWNLNLTRLTEYASRLDRAGKRAELYAALDYLSRLRPQLTKTGVALMSGLKRLGGNSCDLRPPIVTAAFTLPALRHTTHHHGSAG